MKKSKVFIYITSILLIIYMFYLENIFGATKPNIFSENAIAIDNNTGRILFEKNGKSKIFPASTTKIITAIMAIENLDLNDMIKVSESAISSTPYGSSTMGLLVDEVISVKDLIYGLLLVSGNDAANVLAEKIGGNIDNFNILMNIKLKEIGCFNTNFTSAHGFHNDNHYSTPYDMAILLKYALNNEHFVKILSTSNYITSATNKIPSRNFKSTNKMLLTSSKFYYPPLICGKTGYTDEAGGTMVSFSKKDNKDIIVCVFNAKYVPLSNNTKFSDSFLIYEYIFNNFNYKNVVDKNSFFYLFEDKKKNFNYMLGLTDNFSILLNEDDKYILTTNFNIDFNKLNKYETNSIGKLFINIKSNDALLKKDIDLVITSYESTSFIDKFQFFIITHLYNILIIILSLLLFIIIFLIIIDIFKKKKLNEKY